MNRLANNLRGKGGVLLKCASPSLPTPFCLTLGGLAWSGMALSALAFFCTASSAQSVEAVEAVPPNLAVPATTGQIITLDEAIARARMNEPNFASAVAAAKVANLDHALARAAVLPSVVYHNQFLYTEPHHAKGQDTNQPPRFIGGNAVHEYTSQAVATETIGLQGITAVARASAASSIANAGLEIARRGLISTVVTLYYSALAADQKLLVARRAADESANFMTLTQHREDARESAHADTIKAQLTDQQRRRDLSDAQLANEKAHLDLAVLLFDDPRTVYTLVPSAPNELPVRIEAEAAAGRHNPDLESALATLHAASLDVVGARAGYLPDLSLSFNYGIDAQQFAIHAPDGSRNLGYSASATLDIPVWDWFSIHDRVKQKTSLREAARVTLTNTQRTLIAQFNEVYNEANAAHDQLQSLADSAATARESLRLTRLRYTAGEATVLEVVDAQSSLTAAEIAREDGNVRYQTALANLQTLTGNR